MEEKVRVLEARLGYRERKDQEGFFGLSTPSSKVPEKPNSDRQEKKPKGARPGHKGIGRRSHDEGAVDRMVVVELDSEMCPDCGALLEKKGWAGRSVVDSPSHKTEKIFFRLAKRYCARCCRNVTAQAP